MKQGLFIASIVLLFFSVSVYSSSLYPVMDRHLVKEANLIFIGQVTSVLYKDSTPATERENPIPHTFVTCRIDEVLKGVAPASNSFTLKMMGGALENQRSKVLQVEGVPEFKVGDFGVFFVLHNGKTICPLVGWQQGFIRINKDIVSNYQGRELILNSDAIYAARLHPLDIRDYSSLDKSLSTSTRLVDSTLFSGLNDETKEVTRDPTNLELVKSFDKSRLTYEYPFRGLQTADLGTILTPIPWRMMPRGIGQKLVYRDMNASLINRKQFSTQALEQIPLRDSTKALLQIDQEQAALENIMLLNRRILEDAYPTFITRSLDQTILLGSEMVLSINTHSPIDGKVVQEQTGGSLRNDGQILDPDPYPEGTRLTRNTYLTHVRKMLTALHTKDELLALPEVPSANSEIPFQSMQLGAVQP